MMTTNPDGVHRFSRLRAAIIISLIGFVFLISREDRRAVEVLKASPEDKSVRESSLHQSSSHGDSSLNGSHNDNDSLGQVEAPKKGKTKWNDIPCPSQVDEADRCDLTDPQWGTPVVLVSYGRSGSSVTWDILSGLSSSGNPDSLWQHAREDTGGSSPSNLAQLNEHPLEHGKCWLETILCRSQHRNRERLESGHGISAVFGTKWKPYRSVLEHPRARQVFEWLADMPEIKIIYNERNPLDVSFSKIKHDHLENLPNHCQGEECQKKAAEQWGIFEVPLEQLGGSLAKSFRTTALVHECLANTTHLAVSYEGLYYSDHIVEDWQKVLRFVGAGDVADILTLDLILSKTTYVATHPESRKDTIANYAEVEEYLKGTKYEHLLYYP